jgi:hypothetical protein
MSLAVQAALILTPVASGLHWVWRRLLLAEKDAIIRAFQRGLLLHEPYNELLADVDARLLQVESGEKPDLPGGEGREGREA